MPTSRLIAILPAVLLFSACATPEKKEAPREPKQYTREQLGNNIGVFASGYNADETKVLICDNRTGIYNAYLLNIGDTTTSPLTSSTKESYFTVDFLPGTDKIIFAHDEGGNENDRLYLKSGSDTTVKDITPWAGSKNDFNGWSTDRKYMYVSSNRRDPKFFDLWKMDTASWKAEMLYRNDSGFQVSGVSSTERYLGLIRPITTDKNEFFLYDRQKKTTTRISNSNEASWYPAAIEKNDSIMYYVTNDGSEFSYLVKYNINSGTGEKYFEDKWDVVGMSISENEKYHTITINDDGKNKVLLFDHAGNQPIAFPEIADADVLGVQISRSEKNMLITAGSSTSPANIYTYNFDSKQLKQLTSSLNKEVDRNDLAKAEVVRFKSFDGKDIPAIYYKPLNASKENKVGALVFVHGGPGGQSRVGYSNTIQYLVNHGYAVLAVNNRGSSGYGKTFYKLDNKDHGNGDLKDCVWGKKWLAEQDYVDTNSIAIMGGSYGGNMVLNALAKHPDEFKAGVNIFGVANWLRTLRNIPPYWESFRKALYDEMGDPSTADSVHLKDASPLYNYQKINKPLLVLQGANDVRVLKVESDEIVEGVKKNGVPVEYVLFPDEGHGFVKKQNQIEADEKTLKFLDKYVRPK
ncbi:MAG TPA: S9 family peptidase, partial [Chitinophagaceae bacterium]|nr:S9 family peptidase [Chitinophagaceae bacterium]